MKEPFTEVKASPKTVLSFGAGVNSVALLILRKLGKVQFDYVVFADTGAEHPETYQYIEEVCIPLCKEIGIPFMRVGSPTLYEDYYEKKIIPFRMFRSCTDRYKIRPIRKWIEANLREATILIGIDAGESQRAKYSGAFAYPLIELGIDREGCQRIIEGNGYPLPIKSGCYFCPFTDLKGWIILHRDHKDLFLKAEGFEQNCRAYPTYHLTDQVLKNLRLAIESQTSLDKWTCQKGEACVFCHE